MARKYADTAKELLADPQHRADIEREKAAILAANQLARLRESLGLTQEALAERLDISQARVSDVERAENVELSTLQRYVEALGGHLEVLAVVNGERVLVSEPEVAA